MLLERCGDALADLEERERVFQDAAGVAAGPIRVSAPTFIARQMLVPAMASFRHDHPGVRFDLDSCDRIRGFVDDPVDVPVRLDAPADSTLVMHKPQDVRSATLASPAHLATHGTPRDLNGLRAHPSIGYRNPTSRSVHDRVFMVEGRTERVRPRPAATDPEAQCAAAALGEGVTQTLAFYATPLRAASSLR